jgi:hypothetical protein
MDRIREDVDATPAHSEPSEVVKGDAPRGPRCGGREALVRDERDGASRRRRQNGA